MRKFNYELENELALIEKEAGKAKAMINDIQDRYHFDRTDFSSLDLDRIGAERNSINWKLVIAFDALCAINDIISGLDSKNEDGAFGQDAPSHEADGIVDEASELMAHSRPSITKDIYRHSSEE